MRRILRSVERPRARPAGRRAPRVVRSSGSARRASRWDRRGAPRGRRTAPTPAGRTRRRSCRSAPSAPRAAPSSGYGSSGDVLGCSRRAASLASAGSSRGYISRIASSGSQISEPSSWRGGNRKLGRKTSGAPSGAAYSPIRGHRWTSRLDVVLRRDERRLGGRHRMPDHDHRRLRARHRVGGRLGALPVGVRPVERHVGRGNVVAPRAERRRHSRPARSVVPVAMDQAERRHRGSAYPPVDERERGRPDAVRRGRRDGVLRGAGRPLLRRGRGRPGAAPAVPGAGRPRPGPASG